MERIVSVLEKEVGGEERKKGETQSKSSESHRRPASQW